jgi:hypothetical protein
MIFLRSFLFFALILSLFSNCQFTGEIPSYIYIDTLIYNKFTPNDFTCVWLYADDNLVGVFETKRPLPVLESGECKISARPGINKNGSALDREYYSPSRLLTMTRTLKKGEIDTISLAFEERDNVTYIWTENFEGSSPTIKRKSLNMPEIKIERMSRPGNNGYVGKINIDTKDTLNAYIYERPDSIPIYFQGVAGYLEISYRSNVPFEIRISAYRPSEGFDESLGLIYQSPDKWRRIYFDFSIVVSKYPNGTFYKPYFRIDRRNINTTLDSCFLYLDDIRIIH